MSAAAVDTDRAGASDTRRTLAIVSAAGFASLFAMRFLDPMVGVIARDLGTDPHNVALLASAFALPYALVQPVVGPMGDAWGKERVITVCLAILTIGLLASALAPNGPTLFAARVVSGAAGGGIVPVALATIGDRVEMSRRQVAIGRFLVFALTGQLVGGASAGMLAEHLHWRGVTALAAALSLAAFAAFAFVLPRRPRQTKTFSVRKALARYADILAIGRARALFAFVFVEGIVIFGPQPFIAPLLEAHGAGGAFEAGIIIAGFAIGGVAYNLTVAWLLRKLELGRMLLVAGVAVGAAFAVESTAPAWTVQAALFFAMGYGFYMLHNTFQTQVTDLTSEARASAMSLHAFAYFCGQALGPAVMGATLDRAGSVPAMVGCALAAVLLGAVSSRLLFGGGQRAR